MVWKTYNVTNIFLISKEPYSLNPKKEPKMIVDDNSKFLYWTKDSVQNPWTAIISTKVLSQMEINVNRVQF